MGYQCFYLGENKEKIDGLKAMLESLTKDYPLARVGNKLIVKKEIPSNLDYAALLNDGETRYNNYIEANNDIVYLSLEGERSDVLNILRKIPNKPTGFSLDEIDTSCFLLEFKEQGYRLPFENDYVILF